MFRSSMVGFISHQVQTQGFKTVCCGIQKKRNHCGQNIRLMVGKSGLFLR